jgi:hypothetical protein
MCVSTDVRVSVCVCVCLYLTSDGAELGVRAKEEIHPTGLPHAGARSSVPPLEDLPASGPVVSVIVWSS